MTKLFLAMPQVETDVSFIDSNYLNQWQGNGGTFTQRSIAKRSASSEIRRALIEECKQDGTFASELSLSFTDYMSPALAKQLEGAQDDSEWLEIYNRFPLEARTLKRLEYPTKANPRTVTLFNRILVYANPLENDAFAPLGARRVDYPRDVTERALAPFRELDAAFSARPYSVQKLLHKRVISHATFNHVTVRTRHLRFEDVVVAMESELSDKTTHAVIDKINRIAEEYNLTEMPYITLIE